MLRVGLIRLICQVVWKPKIQEGFADWLADTDYITVHLRCKYDLGQLMKTGN